MMTSIWNYLKRVVSGLVDLFRLISLSQPTKWADIPDSLTALQTPLVASTIVRIPMDGSQGESGYSLKRQWLIIASMAALGCRIIACSALNDPHWLHVLGDFGLLFMGYRKVFDFTFGASILIATLMMGLLASQESSERRKAWPAECSAWRMILVERCLQLQDGGPCRRKKLISLWIKMYVTYLIAIVVSLIGFGLVMLYYGYNLTVMIPWKQYWYYQIVWILSTSPAIYSGANYVILILAAYISEVLYQFHSLRRLKRCLARSSSRIVDGVRREDEISQNILVSRCVPVFEALRRHHAAIYHPLSCQLCFFVLGASFVGIFWLYIAIFLSVTFWTTILSLFAVISAFCVITIISLTAHVTYSRLVHLSFVVHSHLTRVIPVRLRLTLKRKLQLFAILEYIDSPSREAAFWAGPFFPLTAYHYIYMLLEVGVAFLLTITAIGIPSSDELHAISSN